MDTTKVVRQYKNIIRAYSASLERLILRDMPARRLCWKLKMPRQEFLDYIERQWIYDMSWDTFNIHWKIYHIVPIPFFDHADQKQIELCWNYQNLRPMLIKDGELKGNCPIIAEMMLHSVPIKTDIINGLLEINKPHKDRLMRYYEA